MYVLFNLSVAIISQSVHTSDHPIVHLKYIQFLFVSHTLIKLENKYKNGSLCALKQVPPHLKTTKHTLLPPGNQVGYQLQKQDKNKHPPIYSLI